MYFNDNVYGLSMSNLSKQYMYEYERERERVSE